MRKTRQVDVGGVKIGGGAPVAIQSMSTFSPVDTAYAAAQINALGKILSGSLFLIEGQRKR